MVVVNAPNASDGKKLCYLWSLFHESFVKSSCSMQFPIEKHAYGSVVTLFYVTATFQEKMLFGRSVMHVIYLFALEENVVKNTI